MPRKERPVKREEEEKNDAMSIFSEGCGGVESGQYSERVVISDIWYRRDVCALQSCV